MSGQIDFERRLEDGLRAYLDSFPVGPTPARRLQARRSPAVRFAGGAGAALAAKLALGAAAVAFAAGATTGVLVTHSANPMDWARQVGHVQPVRSPEAIRPVTAPAAAPAASAPGSPPAIATASPAPVAGAPALPTVSAPPLPSVAPTANPLPLPSPSTPALP